MGTIVKGFERLRWQYVVIIGIGLSLGLGLLFPPPNAPGTLLDGPATKSGVVSSRFTGPPNALEMPYVGQIIMIVMTGSLSAAMLAYAVHVARKTSSPLPLLFWLGGLAAVVLEPIADVMGNVIHSPGGAYTVFTVEGHPIPWHVMLCYPWYFGGLPILLFDRMRNRTIKREFWWRHFLLVGMIVPLIEVVPAHYKIWVYYGQQPFKIGATPDGMAAANICAVMLPALVIYMLLPTLTGWRSLLVVPLIPAFAMAGHAGAGVILYIVLSEDTLSLSPVLLQGAGLAAVGMSLMIVWLMLELVYGFTPVRDSTPDVDRVSVVESST